MKKINIIPEIADRFELPADALGEMRLTLTGGSRLMAENHSGIIEYRSERLVLAAGRRKLTVSGSGLTVAAMKGKTLIVSGKIQMLELE